MCRWEGTPTRWRRRVAAARRLSHRQQSFAMDLTVGSKLQTPLRHLDDKVAGKFDTCFAGVIQQDLMKRARIEDLDLQDVTMSAHFPGVNACCPWRGYVSAVFINSSAGPAVKRPEVDNMRPQNMLFESNRRQLARRTESEENSCPCPHARSRAYRDADVGGAFPAGRSRVP